MRQSYQMTLPRSHSRPSYHKAFLPRTQFLGLQTMKIRPRLLLPPTLILGQRLQPLLVRQDVRGVRHLSLLWQSKRLVPVERDQRRSREAPPLDLGVKGNLLWIRWTYVT